MSPFYDPLGYLAEKLREGYLYLVQVFQTLIANSPSLDNLPIVRELYGNALGLTKLLSIGVTFIVLTIVIFNRRRALSLPFALLIFIGVTAGSQLWFSAIHHFELLGNNLSREMINLFNTLGFKYDGLPVIGDISTVLVAILVFGATSLMGFQLVLMFTGYAVFGVALKFFGILILSMLALGKRTQKLFNLVIAIGIVVFALGKVTTNFLIASGVALGSTFAPLLGDQLFAQGVMTTVSMVVALVIQPVLMFLMYKSVTKLDILGKVNSFVSGTVNAIMQDRSNTTVNNVNNVQTAGLQTRSQDGKPISVSIATPPYLRRLKSDSRNRSLQAGAVFLAGKAAAASNPVLGVALKTAAYAVQSAQKGRVQPPLEP